MIKLETINFLKLLITNFIAYVPTITLAGFLSAWFAKKVGDDTAQKKGFLTLNPINHLDFFGMMFMFIPPYLGITRGIPVNTNNINRNENLNKIKTLLLFFSNMIGFFAVLIILSISLVIFQHKILGSAIPMANLSSFLIVIIHLLRTIFQLTIFCIIIHFITAVTRLISYCFLPINYESQISYLIVVIILSILLFSLFGPYIEYLLNLLVINIDKFFTYLLF